MLTKLVSLVLFILVMFNGKGVAFSANSEQADPENPYKVTINLASTTLTLFMDGKKLYEFPVAVGSVATPTPCGRFKIFDKEVNPEWQDPKDLKKIVKSGPDNPLGYRWMAFYGAYGMHGTNAPWAIGNYVSNGCVRMHNADAETVYDLVPVGTPVQIYYERVILESDKDNNTSVGIYPDSYGTEPLSELDIKNKLVELGVYAFIPDEEIEDRVGGSWEPVPIGKVYPVEINDLWIKGKYVEQNGQAYLPVTVVANILKVKADWDPDSGMIKTQYGTAPGYVIKNIVFFNPADAETLFKAKGTINDKNIYCLKNIEVPVK